MEYLRCRARLSALWVFQAVGMSAVMFLMFMMPDVIKGVMAGELGGEPLNEVNMIVWMLFWLIPLIMVVLCLTLSRTANRWLNFILGIIFTLFYIFDVVTHTTSGEVFPLALIILVAAAIIASILIAWFGLRLPEEEL